ncbi:carbohydrate ABC transporter permease [Streptomyces sp. NPDC002795]|uniref:carbohydrate ABC transporter permease n=1 Tax=Streptomyces sp. NPDC002795 TaxID=3364665 RepID=UPI003692EADC
MTTVTTLRRPTAATPPPARRRHRPSATAALRRLPLRLLVGLLIVVEAGPMVWMLLSSFKSQNAIVSGGVFSLPSSLEWSNYSEAWLTGDFAHNVWISVLVTFPALLLLLLFGAAAGFALEIMVWKRRNSTLLYFVAGIMVPAQMLLVPLFLAYFRLGLTQTVWPFILTYSAMGLPLTVFMMAAYFRALPREVFESATLDGASMLRCFFSIALPMSSNALITLGLVEFFSIWNDLLIALTFVTNPKLATVQVGLLNFSGEFGQTAYGPLFAAICMNVLGTLVIFLVLNQRIMKGMVSGAVKG